MIAYIGSFLVLLAFLNALLLVFSRPLMSGALPDYKSIILSSSKSIIFLLTITFSNTEPNLIAL